MASGDWKNGYLSWNVNSDSNSIVWDKDRFKQFNIKDQNTWTYGGYTFGIDVTESLSEPKPTYTIAKYYEKRKTINFKHDFVMFNDLDECTKFLYDMIGDAIEYCIYQLTPLGQTLKCERLEI